MIARRSTYSLAVVVAENPAFGSERWLSEQIRKLGVGYKVRGRWVLDDQDIKDVWDSLRAAPKQPAPPPPPEPVQIRPTEGSLRRRRSA